MRLVQRIGPIATAVALGFSAGSAGAAECGTELAALMEETPDLKQLPQDRALLARRTLRELATAARQLDADGHALACAATLDALSKAMTDFQINVIDTEPAGSIKGAEDLIASDAALNERDPRLVPLTTAGLAFTTRELTGNSVFNYRGEYIGEFQGMLTGPGGYASHVVIGHGGFWDMFEDRAAIPIELVRWDPERRLFYLPFGEDQLGAAPVYDPDGQTWDPRLNDEYYARFAR